MVSTTMESIAKPIKFRGEPIGRRPLGKTGWQSPLITFPGIALMSLDQSVANDVVAEAIDNGVNEFDVAPTYGNAELVLAEAIRGRRQEVFLGCKTEQRDATGSAEALSTTLQRFGTDHVDLYQVHGISSMGDVDAIFAAGGAMETFTRAKREGKTRFVGVTGHDPAALLEAIRRYDFDTVMFPLNFVVWHHSDFGRDLLAEANRREMGVLAIKALATRGWQENEKHTSPNCWYKPVSAQPDVDLALRFALSRPISTAISAGDWRLFEKALIVARHFKPLTADEDARLADMAAQFKPIFPQG